MRQTLQTLLLAVAFVCSATLSVQAADRYICNFKGVGIKNFTRHLSAPAFLDDKGKRFDALENASFLQLRSADLDEKSLYNPFTIYMIDKNTGRIRQISGAMRASPMMADGTCQYVKTSGTQK